jgi:hypothetical protein
LFCLYLDSKYGVESNNGYSFSVSDRNIKIVYNSVLFPKCLNWVVWSVRNGGEQNSLAGGAVMLPDSPWHKDEKETSRNSCGDDYNHNFTTSNATYVDENIRLAKPTLRILSCWMVCPYLCKIQKRKVNFLWSVFKTASRFVAVCLRPNWSWSAYHPNWYEIKQNRRSVSETVEESDWLWTEQKNNF